MLYKRFYYYGDNRRECIDQTLIIITVSAEILFNIR